MTPSATPKKNSADDDGYYYLSADAREKLPEYQYRGCDKSLLYQYVLSPLAEWCVQTLVPRWTAPNTITLIGLVWMISAYMAYWYYVPTLTAEEPPPRWIFLWNAISMLAYQTLDNMDGKQARRTKSSSPLGLLFDHGCDAANCILGSAGWIIGLGLDPSQELWACWIAVFIPMLYFYHATWEQYYTGEMILPIVNGPNEGLLGAVVLSMCSYWYGPSYWQSTEAYETYWEPVLPSFVPVLRNCDWIFVIAMVYLVQEILLRVVPVSRKYPNSAKNVLPCYILATCYWTIGWVAPNVWLNLPRTSLHLASILFVDMTVDLMVAHVTEQVYTTWRWQLLPLVLLTVWLLIFGYNNPTIDSWILAYTVGMGAYLSMKIVLLIHEVCNVLGIWCFDIITPYTNHKMPSLSNGHAKEQ